MKTKNLLFMVGLIFLGGIIKGNAQYNLFTGAGSGALHTTGTSNTAYGDDSFANDVSGAHNSAFGTWALRNNVGVGANSVGIANSAFGSSALAGNTTGNYNVALGYNSLYNNQIGNGNVAIGINSLYNSRGNVANGDSYNTAVGHQAGFTCNPGIYNTFLGNRSGYSVSQGSNNTCLGNIAGTLLSTGTDNTLVGNQSGYNLITGSGNVMIGRVILPNAASTSRSIGNNTNATIVLADGGSNQRLIIDSNGNTGIGLGSNVIPINKLDVKGAMAIGAGYMSTTSVAGPTAPSNGLIVEGNVGIGTSAPTSKLQITSTTANTSGLRFTNLNNLSPATSNTVARKVLSVSNNATGGDIILVNDISLYDEDGKLAADRTVNMDDKKLIFDTQTSGRIYIGNTTTTNPFTVGAGNNFPPVTIPDSNYKLLVEGGVLTEKVKIALRYSGTDWADYVFANDYKLMPLKELESFVNENKHLPGISSATDLVKNGLDVADMQAKQMGKIEELTLYVIKQDKEIEELKAQVKALIEKSK